jgi:hypothetical protein
MTARDRILGRVRGAVTGQGDRAAAVAARLAQHPAGPVPAQATSHGPQRLRRFMAKLEEAAGSVGRVSSRCT